MNQGSGPFSAEIRRYEEILVRDPNSFCFAPLAELYRKAGRLDDAVETARRGIELHPEYIGGYLALGRACFDKGEQAESRSALERVVRVTPDNLVAQRLLSRIYTDIGEYGLARRALQTILDLNPDDAESREALESLSRREEGFQPDTDLFQGGEGEALSVSSSDQVDESLLEEVEIIEELTDELLDGEMLEEGAGESGCGEWDEPSGESLPLTSFQETAEPLPDPLATETIAELYVKQGFLKKALKIYRDILEANPGNEGLKNRIIDLKRRIDEDEARARENALTSAMPFGDEMKEHSSRQDASASTDEVVSVLEGWLANIGRIKECRSGRH